MHPDTEAARRSVGHFELDHRLTRHHRDQVARLTTAWRVGPASDTVEPADLGDVELAVRLLRVVVREVLGPSGVAMWGAVVVETPDGLVTVTVSGRRVSTRRWGPGSADHWGLGRPVVEECRVVRLDDRRPRTAGWEEPWIG